MTEQYPRLNINVNPRGARYIASAPGSNSFDLTFDDDIVIADSAAGLLILTLPRASEFEGFEVTIHAPSATLANYVIIQAQSGETIVGPGAVALNVPGQAIKLASQFNFEVDVDNPDASPTLIRSGWYCTDECAGRDPDDCPQIATLVPNTVPEDSGFVPLTMTGSFDPVNDAFETGTLLVDGAFPFIDIQPAEVDLILDTDIVEPGVYWIGVIRSTTNCATFVQLTIEASEA